MVLFICLFSNCLIMHGKTVIANLIKLKSDVSLSWSAPHIKYWDVNIWRLTCNASCKSIYAGNAVGHLHESAD